MASTAPGWLGGQPQEGASDLEKGGIACAAEIPQAQASWWEQGTQILSVHPFEKISLHELLMKSEFKKPGAGNFNQMELFDL